MKALWKRIATGQGGWMTGWQSLAADAGASFALLMQVREAYYAASTHDSASYLGLEMEYWANVLQHMEDTF